MISILVQAKETVRRRRWPTGRGGRVRSLSSTPAGFADAFWELHRAEPGEAALVLGDLVGGVQAGEELSALLLLCVFDPNIRAAAMRFRCGVDEVVGVLMSRCAGYGLDRNVSPTPWILLQSLNRDLVRIAQKSRRLVPVASERLDEISRDVDEIDVSDWGVLDEWGINDADRELLVRMTQGHTMAECAEALGVGVHALYKRREALRARVGAHLAA